MRAPDAKVLIISVEGMAILSLKVLAKIDDDRLWDAWVTHPELLILFAKNIVGRAPFRSRACFYHFDTVLGGKHIF